ncbi:MAG: tetratricopeptide repeat protein [Candidatus Kapaibacterium sp.]
MKIKLSNIIHWLLLASLLAFLGSCGNMSSVRNGKYIVAKSEKIEEIKNTPSDSLLLAMYKNENEITALTGNEEKPVEVIKETPIKRIPTLQEQMNNLADRQDNFDDRLTKIESQNNKISNKLEEITELLKSKKQTNTETATTGINPEKKEPNEAFVLYPDHKAQGKKRPVTKRQSTPVIEPDVKKEESTIFKSAVDMVDKQDYNGAVLMLLKEEQKLSDPNKLAECRYLIAKSFLSLNRYTQAQDYYAKVLSSNIDFEKKAEAQAGIAKIHLKKGDREEAKKAYKTILDKYATTQYVIEAKKMLQQL